MNINENSIIDLNTKISYFSFCLIFWGYILYNFLIYFNITSSILGGYFGVFCLLSALLFFPTLHITTKLSFKFSVSYSFLIYISFFICVLYTLLNFIFNNNILAVKQSLELIIFWICLYNIGFYFVLYNKINFIKYSFFLSLLLLIYVIYYFFTSNLYMLPFGTSLIEDENVASYQGLARNILVIALVCFSFSQTIKLRIFFLLSFSIILFSLGARSEFFIFLTSIIVYQLITSLKIRANLLVSIVVISLIGIFYSIFYDFISNSRLFNVTNLSEDNSWNSRTIFQDYALKTIKENYILGDFGSHTTVMGNLSTGTYSHNILSGYVNYGLLFFLLMSAICYTLPIYSFLKLFKNPKNPDWSLCFLLTFSVSILITFSKPVFWPIIYLSWGIFIGTIYKYKGKISY